MGRPGSEPDCAFAAASGRVAVFEQVVQLSMCFSRFAAPVWERPHDKSFKDLGAT